MSKTMDPEEVAAERNRLYAIIGERHAAMEAAWEQYQRHHRSEDYHAWKDADAAWDQAWREYRVYGDAVVAARQADRATPLLQPWCSQCGREITPPATCEAEA